MVIYYNQVLIWSCLRFAVDLLFMLALKQQKSPQKTKEFYLTDVAKDTFRDAFNKIQENLKGISGADDLLSGE